MKTPEQERLLTDVLHDESYVAFRSELRQAMLRRLRAGRRRRLLRPLLAIAACVPAALAAHWWLQSRAQVSEPASAIATVRSVPLRPEQIVTTANAMRDVALVRSRAPEPSSVVATVTLPVEGLSDDELLALFKGRAVALVGTEGDRRLMLLDEQDRREDH
jgi:hypothetical protein